MKIQYKIFKNRGLLIHRLSGEWAMVKYKEYVMKIVEDPDFKYVTKILSDLRELNMSVKVIHELDDLATIRKEVIKKKFLNVHIVSSPSSTVIAHLYIEKLAESGYAYNYAP